MKNLNLLSILAFFVISAASAQPALQWAARFNGPASGADKGNAIAYDDSGNVYVTGKSDGIGTGIDFLTIKYNANGDTLWTRRYNSSANLTDEPNAIWVDVDKNVYVTGRSQSNTSKFNIVTIKYDSAGVQQWAAVFNTGAIADFTGFDLLTDIYGNVYVVGSATYFSGSNLGDGIVIKYNPAGTKLWSIIVNNYYGEEKANLIKLNSYGNIVVSNAVDVSGSFIVLELSPSNGSLIQKYNIPFNIPFNYNPIYGIPNAMVLDGVGNIYILSSNINFNYPYEVHTAKFAHGVSERSWDSYTYTYGSNNTIYGVDLKIDANNNTYTLADYYNGNNHDYYIKKNNPSGNTLWKVEYNAVPGIDDIPASLAIDNLNTPNVFVNGYSPTKISTVGYDNAGNQLWDPIVYDCGIGNTNIASQMIMDNCQNIYITGASNCDGTNQDFKTIKYSASVPPVITPTGSTTFCQGGSVILSAGACAGCSYQWSSGQTGQSIVVSPASTTSYTVSVTSSGCNAVSLPVTVTVNPVLTPSVSITASNNAICAGQSVSFTAAATNGGTAPSYQWYVNNIAVGTGPTYSTSTLSNGAQVRCTITSNADCATPATANSNLISVTVNPLINASVNITAVPNVICAGGNVTFTAISTNGGNAPTYKWFINNTLAGTGPTYSTTNLTNGAQVYCVMTSNAACVNQASVNSNSVSITVNPVLTPSVSITASSNFICEGQNVTFTATSINGGPTPMLQWFVNGVPAGTGTTYSTTNLSNGAQVTCILTSNAACVNPTTANSNVISITVSPILSASVSISVPQTTICAGQSLSFTAMPVNGGSAPTYQWFVNNSLVGTGPTYSTTTLSNGAQVRCTMTSNSICAIPSTANSNLLSITVNPTLAPTVSVAPSSTSICAGESVSFTATSTNGGNSPVYQWFVNNVQVPGSGPTYTTTSLANGAQVRCTMLSNATCASPQSASSNSISVTVNPIQTPNVSIAGNTPVCSGQSLTLTATTVNDDSMPSYQWYLNNNPAGNGPTFTSPSLANGDQIYCVMSSNAACLSTTTATSTTTFITVIAPPNVQITTNESTTFCQGKSATLTASPSGAYLWSTGATTKSITVSTAGNYTVTVTTSNTCSAASSPVTITVNPLPQIPTIFPPGPITLCQGELVTLTASFEHSWKWNTGENTQSIDVHNSGNYSVVVTNVNACSAESVPITVTVLPTAQPAISLQIICTSLDTTVVATPIDGGLSPVFQWWINDLPQTETGPVLHITNGLPTWVVKCQMTTNETCPPTPPTSEEVQIQLLCIDAVEVLLPEHFSLSPNPSSGLFTVKFYLPEEKTVTHRVLNMLGQVVWAGTPAQVTGEYQRVVDLGENVVPGMYLLETRLDGWAFLRKVEVR